MENTYIIESRIVDHFESLKYVIKARSNNANRINMLCVHIKDGIYYATDGNRLHVYSPDYDQLPDDYFIPDGVYEVLTNNKKQIIFRLADMESPDFYRILNYRPYNGVSPFVYHSDKKYGDNFDLLLYHVFTQTEQCFNRHYLEDAAFAGVLKFERTSEKKGGLCPLIMGNYNKFAVIMPLKQA